MNYYFYFKDLSINIMDTAISVIDSFTIPDFDSNILVIFENGLGYAVLTIINDEIYTSNIMKEKITDIISVVKDDHVHFINNKYLIYNVRHYAHLTYLKTFVDNNMDLFTLSSNYVLK